MKNILKRGLSLALALIMVMGLMPVTAQAAADDDTGMPLDLEDKVILSVYIPEENEFPGEPAVHSNTGSYRSFNSSFQVANSPTFASKASSLLKDEILPDLLEGTPSGGTFVHGVYDVNGLEKYFKDGAELLKDTNEQIMIDSVFDNINENADPNDYEIVWYVIKLQHKPKSWFLGRDVTEWHIDGIIKEKEKISINYYGNGNTSGAAPNGTMNHVSGDSYVIEGNDHANKMVKLVNGVPVEFLGWNTRSDGTGITYLPGKTIEPTESLSLYAMWDNYTVHTATVNTYLDGALTSVNNIYGADRKLSLRADNNDAYDLTEKSTGVYTADINGNGTFYLYAQEGSAAPVRISDDQLTIYNQSGTLNVHHYSVTYRADDVAVDEQIYLYGDTVTAAANATEKDGYRFVGWEDEEGNLIQPGKEVTASISEPVVLTARWEKTVNVKINVTIDHNTDNSGLDQTNERDDVFLYLVNRADKYSPYLEIGEPLEMKNAEDALANGFTLTMKDGVSTYTATEVTYADMPGGTTEYSVVTSKPYYDVKPVVATKVSEDEWVIDVEMVYRPTNFDLQLSVQVDDQVPEDFVPEAAIVKISFWSSDRQDWEIITQHDNGAPGVRVNIDQETREGSGSYPVWMDETENNPYGYRIRVSAFVYPDGTIVPVTEETKESNQQWTDEVYIAKIISDAGIGGKQYGDSNTGLAGAYYDAANKTQVGKLEAVITMDLHDVTFNANGGEINGENELIVSEQYKVPAFKDYVPVRDGGYVFAGWYLEENCTNPAQEGADLKGPITLYAKWNDPLTISGTVYIAGTYELNKETVHVNQVDKATEAVVVLQEIRNEKPYDVKSQLVILDYKEGSEDGSGTYEFTGIPDDGKEYRIQLLLLNYDTKYDNDADEDFNANEYNVEFGDNNEAIVDAQLTFVPPSYDQKLVVKAEGFGSADYIPQGVLAKVTYRDTGDKHPFQVISQHRDTPELGVQISLTNGEGDGETSIWKWHTNGTLYDYQMLITRYQMQNTRAGFVDYDSETAPFYITYGAPVSWDDNIGNYSGELVATLRPKQYLITFDLNAGDDPVTGVDKLTYIDENGDTIVINGVIHTWSSDTPITTVPQREGYTFLGWKADEEGVYTDGKIPATVQQEVTLTAQWEKITYKVTTEVTPNGGGTAVGADTYDYGAKVTLTATANPGYTFVGWKENEVLISNSTTYAIDKLTDNRSFVAEFSRNQYSVVVQAEPQEGGAVVVSGNGIYAYGEQATMTATENTGYTFAGWYNGSEKVSDEHSFSVVVTENLTYVAKFEAQKYTVTTNASPAEGGNMSGNGTYDYGTEATVNATAKPGYAFVGWKENGNLVSETAEYTFTVKGDRILTAEFVRRYTVTVTTTEGGVATPVSSTYNAGDTAMVVATPIEGYKFMGWYKEGILVDTNTEYRFEVTSDCTLKASFAPADITITVIADAAEGGTVTGGGAYASGEKATVTAVANSEYVFIGWYENGSLKEEAASYTWEVLYNRTLTAKFVKKTSYRSNAVYLFGYQDTEIGAEGTLLRGELAQMIYRLVRQNKVSKTNGKVFEDTSGQWFQSGMAYMEQVGAIDSEQKYGNPYAEVSRGEAYKMICLGLKFTDNADLRPSQYATILRSHGYSGLKSSINGTIRRWEFCELFNSILGRSGYTLEDADGKEITADTYGYKDLDPSKDYYDTMLIATSAFDKNGYVDIAARVDRDEYDYDN